MTAPTLFSTNLPALQLAWDATSLRALQFCPQYYNLAVRQGWRSDTIDLDFGVMAHSAMDKYDRLRALGASHDLAQLAAVKHVLMVSAGYRTKDEVQWELEPGLEVWKPWGGQYMTMWRCTAMEPYGKKGKGGGKLKCPNAKAHVWWPGHGPTTCPECFSPTESVERWLPQKPEKSRPQLVRTVVWWTEELKDSPIKTLLLPDGTPMVEQNFQVSLPWGFWKADPEEVGGGCMIDMPSPLQDAERFILCGYYDGGCSVGSENFLRERKTTGKALAKQYWSGFSPNVQIDTYDLSVTFLEEVAHYNFRGVLVEAAQTLVGGSRFGWKQLYRTEPQREEHLREIEQNLREAVDYAKRDYWPMRKSQCPVCPFKGVCSKEPGLRRMFLEANFKQVRWNPLEER